MTYSCGVSACATLGDEVWVTDGSVFVACPLCFASGCDLVIRLKSFLSHTGSTEGKWRLLSCFLVAYALVASSLMVMG